MGSWRAGSDASAARRALLLGSLLLVGAGVGGCRREEPPLPALARVTDFSLTDQRGQPFGAEQLDGKVWVAAFMFTRCPTVCPLMVARMQRLQALARERGVPLHFASFSVDPEHDTPAVLRAFARERGLDLADWVFLTGDSQTLRDTAEHGFKIGVDGRADPSKEHYGITHGTHLVLLDAQRTIRGYYQSSDERRVQELLRDAARLSKESRAAAGSS